MDNALIQLIARLKIRLRQDKGISINTQRFFDERSYAMQILDAAEESENIEIVGMAMEMRDKLGWLRAPSAAQPSPASTPTARANGGSSTATGRYVFGARS